MTQPLPTNGAASSVFRRLHSLCVGCILSTLACFCCDAAELEVKPQRSSDWTGADRAKWMDVSKSLDADALDKWFKSESHNNTFVLAAFENTKLNKPNEYTNITERQAYYDLISYVLEKENTDNSKSKIRFFHATAAITTRGLLGFGETNLSKIIGGIVGVDINNAQFLVKRINGELFSLNMAVIAKLLEQRKNIPDPKQLSDKTKNLTPFQFDMAMIDVEQSAVERILKNQSNIESSRDLDLLISRSVNLNPTMSTWLSWATEAGYSEIVFSDLRWRKAVGRAMVVGFHKKKLNEYFAEMEARKTTDLMEIDPAREPENFAALINACPAPSLQAQFLAKENGNYFHSIELAKGPQLNIDRYEVKIDKMPVLPGARRHATPAEFANFIRVNFKEFLDPIVSDFQAMSKQDDLRWKSKDPLGSIMIFRINPIAVLENKRLPAINAEQAAVITSELIATPTSHKWRFATVHTTNTENHPVSGNREFGLEKNGADWLFITSAADRPTGILDRMGGELVFKGADLLWKSLQLRVIKFTVEMGGHATMGNSFNRRVPWNDVTHRRIFTDRCKWQTRAFGQQLDARSSRAVLALTAERDPTGMTAALGVSVLNAIRDNPTKQAEIINSANSIGKKIRNAKSPAEIEKISNTEEARAFNLQFAKPVFDPTTLKYVDPRNLGGFTLLTASLVDSDAKYTISNFSKRLFENAELPVASENYSAFLEGIAGIPAGSTVESVVASMGDTATQEVLTKVVKAAARGASAPNDLKKLGNELVGRTVSMLVARNEDVRRVTESYQQIDKAFKSPAIKELWAQNINADSLSGGAQVLSSLAAISGNEDFAKAIDDSMRKVQGGIEIYKSAALIAGAFSGGTFIAAVGLLNGAGSLGGMFGGNNDNYAAMMRAIAALSQMIVRQFEIVNGKLDSMQVALSRIERDLREIKQLQRETLTLVRETHSAVMGLYTRIDQLEINILKYLVQSDADACLSHIRFKTPANLTQETFRTCLATFSRIARQDLPALTVPDGASSLVVLADHYSTEKSLELVDRLTGAWLVAELEGQLFKIPDLVDLAEKEKISKNVSSAAFAVEGANAYSALVRRRGERRIKPGEVKEYEDVHALAQITTRLEAMEEFRIRLAGLGRDQKDRLISMVQMYKSGQTRVSATFVEQREIAVKALLIPRLKSDVTFPFLGKISECESSQTVYELSSTEFKQLDLPDIANSHGGIYHENDTQLNSVKAVAALPGLKVCLKSLTKNMMLAAFVGNDQPYNNWNVFGLRGDFEVSLFGKNIATFPISLGPKAVTFPRAYSPNETPSAADQLALLRGPFLSRLKEYFHDPKVLDALDSEMAVALLSSENPVVQLRSLAALHSYRLTNAGAQKAIRDSTEQLDGSLALIRGHLQIAFPATYAAHDRLRSQLEGNESQRAPDRLALEALAGCASKITSSDSVDKPLIGNLPISEGTLRDNCGPSLPINWFSVSTMKTVQPVFESADQRLLSIINETHFEDEEAYSSNSTSVAAAKIRAFMRDGGRKEFYPVPD